MSDNSNKTRPTSLDDIIGLEDVKQSLKYDLLGAKARKINPPHYILSASPGQGKTTLANIIAVMNKGSIHRVLGNDLKTPDDIYTLLQQCKDGDVIFVEESHGISKKVDNVLLPILEEGIIIGGGAWGLMQAPKIVFIFATTNAGKLSQALRTRCKTIQLRLYTIDELTKIIKRAASILGHDLVCPDSLMLLAKSSRGTPRTAVEQRLESVLNVMAVDNLPFTIDTVKKSLELNGINEWGLEKNDLDFCETLYKIQCENGNRPVSLKIISQTLNLSDDVINIIEQYLHQIGAILITPRGRVLTDLGYEIIGKDRLSENMPLPYKASISNKSINIDNIDFETRLNNGEFKSIRDICIAYHLTYGPDNELVKNELEKYGYTARRRAGIVKCN